MVLESIKHKKSKEAVYQISVQGRVDPLLLQSFAQIHVSYNKNNNDLYSTLTGPLKDQAALSGLLNNLFNHQHKIISVIKL